jgi:hypothetical protein
MHSPKTRKPTSTATPVTPERTPTKAEAGSPVPVKKNPFGGSAPKSPGHPGVKEVYQLVHKATGSIGGNADGGTIYGEISEGSMQKVLNILKDTCKMNEESAFIDIGAGLGKPNFHAAQQQVLLSIGVELNTIRHQLSMQNLTRVVTSASDAVNVSGVNFIDADITKAKSLNPFTHIYQFDLGFEPPLHHYIADMFNSSESCQYLISYRRPLEIEKYGYKVTHLAESDTPTSMCGSGEGHTCYFYEKNLSAQTVSTKTKKAGHKVSLTFAPAEVSADEDSDSESTSSDASDPATNAEPVPLVRISIPAAKRVASKLTIKEIKSDPLWAKDIEVSLCRTKLAQHCKEFNEKYFTSARPQRTSCRSPQRYTGESFIKTKAKPAAKEHEIPMSPVRAPKLEARVVTPNTTPPRSRKTSDPKVTEAEVVAPTTPSRKAKVKVAEDKSPKKGPGTPKRGSAKTVALVF